MDAASESVDRRAALRVGAAIVLGAPLLALLGACAPAGPRPIAYGHDSCAFCRMTVSDSRYGAELVTAKGRVQTFDSIECLASACIAARGRGESAPRALQVTDARRPGTLIDAAGARFTRITGPGSPMGKGLAAYSSGSDAPAGVPLSWTQVLAMVEREGLSQGIGAGPSDATR